MLKTKNNSATVVEHPIVSEILENDDCTNKWFQGHANVVVLSNSMANIRNHISALLQVLEKCQLLEAVQEKEQGLDSPGRSLCLIYSLVSEILERF